jgi:hypothetical protein
MKSHDQGGTYNRASFRRLRAPRGRAGREMKVLVPPLRRLLLAESASKGALGERSSLMGHSALT